MGEIWKIRIMNMSIQSNMSSQTLLLFLCKKYTHISRWAIFVNQTVSIFFLFLHENIYCEYWLEAPRRVASNKYPQRIFS